MSSPPFPPGFFDRIVLQVEEISEYRLTDRPTALGLLTGPLRRRVGASFEADRCCYLEDGVAVRGVTP